MPVVGNAAAVLFPPMAMAGPARLAEEIAAPRRLEDMVEMTVAAPVELDMAVSVMPAMAFVAGLRCGRQSQNAGCDGKCSDCLDGHCLSPIIRGVDVFNAHRYGGRL